MRYIVIDSHGAIRGHMSGQRRWKVQLRAEQRYGVPCELVKAWMTHRLVDLWFEDRGRCHLCGGNVPVTVHREDPRAASADHLLPRVHGGTRVGDNLRLAHRYCNSRRNERDVEDWPQDVYATFLEQATRGLAEPEGSYV